MKILQYIIIGFQIVGLFVLAYLLFDTTRIVNRIERKREE